MFKKLIDQKKLHENSRHESISQLDTQNASLHGEASQPPSIEKNDVDQDSAAQESTNKYLEEIQGLRGTLAQVKLDNETTVDNLYKQLEMRTAKLDESLVSESPHS